ncbi:MAG: tetratricopeptide repeat protein [Alphaproteobacteria bacterium]
MLILGNIFYLRRNYEKALEWYRKMQKVAPGDVSLKINIANTFHAMRNYAEARRYAQEVLKPIPKTSRL